MKLIGSNLLYIFLTIIVTKVFGAPPLQDKEIFKIAELLNSQSVHISIERINEIYQHLRNQNESPENVRLLRATLSRSFINGSVDPCDDFYAYACGNWERFHPIPDEKSEYYFLQQFEDNIYDSIKNIFNKLSVSQNEIVDGENVENAIAKSAAFYTSCMDTELLDKRGNAPLKRILKSYGEWNSPGKNLNENWLIKVAELNKLGVDAFLTFSCSPNPEDARNMAPYIFEGTPGTRSTSTYTQPEEEKNLKSYRNLIEDCLILLDIPEKNAKEMADEILQFETEVANVSHALSYDLSSLSVQNLTETYPKFNWGSYFRVLYQDANMDPDELSSLLVGFYGTDYYNAIQDLIEKTQPRILNNYFLWRITLKFYSFLDSRFQKAQEKYERETKGTLVKAPRWKECAIIAKERIGDILSELYLRIHFDEDSKKLVYDMVKSVRDSFEETLINNEWLDEVTKEEALHKLHEITIEAGYPDYLLKTNYLDERYANIPIKSEEFFENIVNIDKHTVKETIAATLKSTNKTVWEKNPIEVNAFFHNPYNKIYVTAAILQSPVYHKHFPKFVNYGGVGVFLGHELAHGFDSLGRTYNYEGNLLNWWTEKAEENYEMGVECFIEKYENFTINGKSVNGKLSVGENIADNGGIKSSFHSYKKFLENNEEMRNEEYLPGFNMTPYQLFFLSFAQNWCEIIRPELLNFKLRNDPHLPGEIRVRGVLSNMKEFAEEFNCPIGSPMNPERKCQLL